MSPRGRPEGEDRSAVREGSPMSAAWPFEDDDCPTLEDRAEARAATARVLARAEPAPLARNMSVMPRTTLSFAALAPAVGATGDAVADGTSLAFVCRLDARALLPKALRERDPEKIASKDPDRVHDRIRVALVYAQAESTKYRRAKAGALAQACATPVEEVADLLRELLVAHPLAENWLPRVGLFLPPGDGERTAVRSLTRTLAILARRRGTLFLRDADPIVWSAVDGEVLDLWTPVVPGRAA